MTYRYRISPDLTAINQEVLEVWISISEYQPLAWVLTNAEACKCQDILGWSWILKSLMFIPLCIAAYLPIWVGYVKRIINLSKHFCFLVGQLCILGATRMSHSTTRYPRKTAGARRQTSEWTTSLSNIRDISSCCSGTLDVFVLCGFWICFSKYLTNETE